MTTLMAVFKKHLLPALRRQDFRGEDLVDQMRPADIFEVRALLLGCQPRADALVISCTSERSLSPSQ